MPCRSKTRRDGRVETFCLLRGATAHARSCTAVGDGKRSAGGALFPSLCSGMSGTASSAPTPFTEATTAQQSTDWYGTVRGRAGWLATPNLLLFGTGGFAYGRVRDSAADLLPAGEFAVVGPASVQCPGVGGVGAPLTPCLTGSSSAIRTGWTAGGGVEWLLDQHWSAKIEYQFVDLGTETIRATGLPCTVAVCGLTTAITSSFNAAFRDQFNVVRLGLNYRF